MNDLIIVGCGSAGYEAALTAVKFSKKVLCIEKAPQELGGTCLNRGCVPTKFLREGALLTEKIENSSFWGIENKGFNPLLLEAINNSQKKVIEPIRNNLLRFLKSKKVQLVFSPAVKFLDKNSVQTADGKVYKGKFILLATGSRPTAVGNIKPDGEYILDTDTFWNIKETPKKVLIVGGGVSGVEFAYILRRYGVQKVYLVELAKAILPTAENFSKDLVKRLEKALKNLGVEIFTSTTVEEIDPKNRKVVLKGGLTLEGIDKILLTVGRKPNTDNLGLEEIGLKLDPKGFVEIKKGYQTEVENIFAVGDIIKTPALAHVAKREAQLAVKNIFQNQREELDYSLVPSVVYSVYELAAFGKNGEQLRREGIDFKTLMLNFRSVAKALSQREEGLIQIFTSPDGQILGANILCKKCSDALIHYLTLVKKERLPIKVLKELIWAHPTVEEVFENLPL
ncbi:MAG: NAD(P)/FAD-dependent oxidoreductase [Aquificae bacterium]|nr:NAD(P)/FAD-dependent oxidoreductase [Aquificota bacterium]